MCALEVVQSTGNAVHAGTEEAAVVATRDVGEGEELLSDAHNPNERWRVDVVVMSRVDEGGEIVVHHLPLGLALDQRSSGPVQRRLELQSTFRLAAVRWSVFRGRVLAF